MNGANLNGASVTINQLRSAKKISDTKIDLQVHNLEGWDFYFSDMPEANLEGADLKGLKADDVTWTGANLKKAALDFVLGKKAMQGGAIME